MTTTRIAFLLVVMCGCSRPPRGPDPRVVDLLGGEAVHQTISHPTKVEVFRIKVSEENQLELSTLANSVKSLDEYPLGDPIELDNATSQGFVTAITDQRTYLFDEKSRKACLPTPGVAVRFQANDQSVDVLICFECDMLTTLSRDKPHWVDSNPGRVRLVNLVKKLFPNDSQIQELQLHH